MATSAKKPTETSLNSLYLYGYFRSFLRPLTTSVDTVNFAGSYNAINGTGTTFTAYDSITGNGFGVGNTLNVNDVTGGSAAGVPAGVVVSGVQTANIKSSGSIGGGSSTQTVGTTVLAVTAASVAGVVNFTYNGVAGQYATTTGAVTSGTNLAVAINAIAGSTVAAVNGTTGAVTVTSATAQSPSVAFTSSTGTVTVPTITYGTATVTIDAALYDVSGWSGLTAFNGESIGGTNLKATTGVNVSLTNEDGGLVSVTKSAAATITNDDSVDVLGATGAVSINIVDAKPTTVGSNTAAGVLVTGGTTVSVTEAAATLNAAGTTATSLSNNTQIVIGAVSGPTNGATSTGYPQVIAGLSSDPTGNVTTNVSTTFTNTSGLRDVIFGTGTVAAYTNGANTVSVTGSGGATITDVQTTLLKSSASATAVVAGASNLTTVNLAGMSGNSTITSDAISTVSITDTVSASGVTIAGSSATKSNTGALNLTVGNATTTVTTPNNTSIAINAVNSAYQAIGGTAVSSTSTSTLTLDAAKATSLTFAGTSKVALASSGNTLTALTSVTSTSAGTVALGDVSGYTKLTSINAAAATGALTATIGASANVGLAITGGSGNDAITLLSGTYAPSFNTSGAAVNTNIQLGSGNDAVYATVGASITISAGTVINAGTGTDTVSASLLTAGTAGVFSGFEILDTVSAAGLTVDASLIDATGISYHGADSTSIAATTDTATIQNIANDSTLSVTGYTNQAALATGYLQNITQTHIDGAGTTAITFNAAPAAAAGTGTGNYSVIGTLTTTGDTAISINSTGGTYQTGNGINTLALTGNTLTTITITGDKAFTLGNVTTDADGGASVLELIDGSTATGALTITAGATVTGSSGATYDGLTINGGTAADTITIKAADGTVYGGLGGDTLTVGAQVAGVTLWGGAGADNFVVTSALVDSASANTIVTALGDVASTDTILMKAAASGKTFNFSQTAVDISSAQNLDEAIDLAATASSLTNTVSYARWFQYGGNTYLVETNQYSTSTSGIATSDYVVELVGLVNLASSTINSTTGVLTIV